MGMTIVDYLVDGGRERLEWEAVLHPVLPIDHNIQYNWLCFGTFPRVHANDSGKSEFVDDAPIRVF